MSVFDLNYEFRVAEPGKDWKDIKHYTLRLASWKDAAAHANEINKKERKEVRINYAGSLQGYYFLP